MEYIHTCQEAIERFAGCLERIRAWMASNRLKLNEDKTQIIWLGTRHQLNKTLPQTLTLRNGTVLQFSTAVKNLGVLIDSQLTMADHIAAVCRSGFFSAATTQVDQIVAVKTLVHAFISSRLDYCNQLFVGFLVGCRISCSHSRTLLLAWSLEPQNSTGDARTSLATSQAKDQV